MFITLAPRRPVDGRARERQCHQGGCSVWREAACHGTLCFWKQGADQAKSRNL